MASVQGNSMDPDKKNPELLAIVQKMIEEGQSEEDIAAVIREFDAQEIDRMKYKGPDTFWEGVNESLYPGGEAQTAAAQGGLGFLKGATLNLPGSILSGLGSVASAIANPRETIESIPNAPGAIRDALGGMWETTKQAGTNPFEFGEMTGEIMGQPAVTAGIMAGAPGATRLAGVPVRGIGNIMQRNQPISGMVPRLFDVRSARNLEKWAGNWIARGGQRMMGGPDFDVTNPWPRPPVIEGEVVPPWFTEGEVINPQNPALPPSMTTQTGYPRASPPTGGVLPATTVTRGIQPELIPQSSHAVRTLQPGLPPGPTIRELAAAPPTPNPYSGIYSEPLPPNPALPPATSPITTQTGYPRASPPTGGTLPATTATKGIQPELLPSHMTGTKPLTTPAPTKPPNVTLKREFTTPENIDKIMKNGYKFMGISSNGAMRFSKG